MRNSSVCRWPVSAWRDTHCFLVLLVFDSKRVRQVFFLLAIGAMGFALYLSYIEDRILLVWCLYCVISQATITLVLLTSGLRLFFERAKD